MRNKIKISDLPRGMVIWNGFNILGITGYTLPIKYYESFCVEVNGNDLDYELVKEK